MERGLRVNERYRNIDEILCIISIFGFIMGSFLGILSLSFEDILLGNIASVCFIICVLPFLFLQILVSAGFKNRITENVKYKFLYFIIFPSVDIFFLLGVNGCFNLIPNFHFICNGYINSETIDLSMCNFLLYTIMIYLSLNIIGLFIRLLK